MLHIQVIQCDHSAFPYGVMVEQEPGNLRDGLFSSDSDHSGDTEGVPPSTGTLCCILRPSSTFVYRFRSRVLLFDLLFTVSNALVRFSNQHGFEIIPQLSLDANRSLFRIPSFGNTFWLRTFVSKMNY